MKKIALINDLSGFGKCSLTAAIPVISCLGVQACPLPTAILSGQTGFPSYYFDDYTDKMNHFTDEWKKMNVSFDGIYSGYLGSSEQMHHVLYFLEQFQTKDSIYLADPVMGDNGKRFPVFTDKLLESMKVLTQKADIITPNLTELCLLAGTEYEDIQAYSSRKDYLKRIEEIAYSLMDKAEGKQTIIVTGILRSDGGQSMIGNLALSEEDSFYYETSYTGMGFSGTGDLFASVIAGSLVQGYSVKDAILKATAFLQPAIEEASREKIDRNHGVHFEKYLGILLKG